MGNSCRKRFSRKNPKLVEFSKKQGVTKAEKLGKKLVVYKHVKAYIEENKKRKKIDCIAVLEISKDATIVSPGTLDGDFKYKIRFGEATVKNIYPYPKCKGVKSIDVAYSVYHTDDGTFKYHKGKKVRPDKPLDRNSRIHCGSGIHAFPTLKRVKEFIDHKKN